jgi:MFS family permease
VLLEAQFGSTLSVFTVDRLGFSAAEFGLLLTANGILVALFQYPVTRLIGRVSRPMGLVVGSLFYVAGYVLLGWIGSFSLVMVTVVLLTAGEVTMSPLASAAVAEAAPEDKRGRYMGFFGLTQTAGVALAPLFGGVLLDGIPSEPRLLWGIIASVGVVAAVGFRVWGRMAGKNNHLRLADKN